MECRRISRECRDTSVEGRVQVGWLCMEGVGRGCLRFDEYFDDE